MPLSGPEIIKQVGLKRITIEPFHVKRVQPASVDLTLGDEVAVYQDFVCCDHADYVERQKKPYDGSHLLAHPGTGRVFDTKVPWALRKFKIDPALGWIIYPGVGYLMHTVERIQTDHYVPVLDGKSSIGRIFVKVHETAGYGDPGFNGQFTLEVTTTMFPVRLYTGMKICQLRFHTLEGQPLSYQETGRYKGEAAAGAIGSKIHESFNETSD